MPKRIYLAVVALTIIAAPVLAKNLPRATVHVALQIRPGLWEYADTPKVTGDTIFPDAMLAHVPPAQRARSWPRRASRWPSRKKRENA
jgi:hypothetical protein